MNVEKRGISVIIPVYNGEKTIELTLKSIMSQTYSEYIKEIIVINDGSVDNTEMILNKCVKENDSAINLIVKNIDNGGVSNARNVGIEISTSKWVALCDSDDTWLPDKIEHQVNILNDNCIDFLGGNHLNKVQKIFFRKIIGLNRITCKELCFKMLPQTSTAIFKKDIYNDIGGYDVNQKYAEDGNFFMKISAKYNYYYDSKYVVFFGNGKEGFGESGLSENILMMHKGILKNLKEMKQYKYINLYTYVLAFIYEKIKYLRRKIVVKWKRKRL